MGNSRKVPSPSSPFSDVSKGCRGEARKRNDTHHSFSVDGPAVMARAVDEVKWWNNSKCVMLISKGSIEG